MDPVHQLKCRQPGQRKRGAERRVDLDRAAGDGADRRDGVLGHGALAHPRFAVLTEDRVPCRQLGYSRTYRLNSAGQVEAGDQREVVLGEVLVGPPEDRQICRVDRCRLHADPDLPVRRRRIR